ncbi:MAG TPA: hypothetical protein VLA20_11845, partial [Vicinamibacterales bacterium]|nr:hypothetical protein [Vicinamibacterales bacterium]
EPLPLAPQELVGTAGFALSPDRTRIVAEVGGDPVQLWLFDVDRAGGQRLTRDGGTWPVWSADGEWVYFGVEGDDGTEIWRKRADLSGEAEQVYAGPGAQRPRSVSTDGAYLYFEQVPDASGDRGWGRLSLDGDRTAEVIVEGRGIESSPWPSPDGRFVAYNSDESGEAQVYVIELATGRRWLLSTGAGPGYISTWTESGEIVFWSNTDSMTSVAVTTEPEFTHAPPVVLHRRPGQFYPYEVTSDGQRFVHTVRSDAADDTGTPPASSRVLVVQNWFEELKRFVPVR